MCALCGVSGHVVINWLLLERARASIQDLVSKANFVAGEFSADALLHVFGEVTIATILAAKRVRVKFGRYNVLLDSGATVLIFHESSLLCNLRKSFATISTTRAGGETIVVDTIGDSEWFHVLF